jgi:hypothetical protein
LAADADAVNESVASATSGLLTLLGIDADPVRSPEHIFISKLLEAAWRSGHDLDLHRLIEHIQRPPFDRVGVVDLESFYPAAQRFQLAMSLNNLMAAPSFASWLQGEPLDIQRMLFSPSGKPRLAVVSIAHLDESQRMFFVTLLLNEVLSWVRTQPGTSSLRALLYMDEVFGYFPPLANPPSKRPMLTLLKQARAYGLGCVLATQNPVDLDYKGLSNAGTWFLGRLQTERDKARVIEGLEGASAEAGSKFNRQQMEATLAGLGKRVFLMNNVHNDTPVVFHTRWAMSYLCGPLTRGQIKTLMDPVRSNFQSLTTTASSSPAAEDGNDANESAAAVSSIATRTRPVLPAGIPERFATARDPVGDNCRLEYRPAVVGSGKVHFVQAAKGIDYWLDVSLLQRAEDSAADDFWAGATTLAEPLTLVSQPEAGAGFADLPARFAREKSYQQFRRDLAEHLYRMCVLELWQNEPLDLTSKVGESQSEFRHRLEPAIAARRASEQSQIEKQFAAKLSRLEDRIRTAESRAATQKWQFWTRATGFLWVLAEGAMRIKGIGRRGRPRSATGAMRTMATERGQQVSAQANLEKLIAEKEELERQRDDQLLALESSFDAQRIGLARIAIKPRKSDIDVDSVALVWLPWSVETQGRAKPLYEVSASSTKVDNESARNVSPNMTAAGEPLARG